MWQYLRTNATKLEVAALVAACFGPYVMADWGLRTEQVVVYWLAIPSAVIVARSMPRHLWPVPWLWIALTAIVTIHGLDPPSPVDFDGAAYIAGIDNFVLPLAGGLVALRWCLRGWTTNGVISTITRVLVPLLAANTLLMVISTYAEMSLVQHWWTASSPEGVTTVAGRAASLGRLTGTFNQPLEAGLAYSVGGLLAVYWFKKNPITAVGIAATATMFAGGLLTTSKVFVVLGLPVALLLLLWLERGKLHSTVVGVVTAVVPLLGVLSWNQWQGVDRLIGMLTFEVGQRSAVDYYTAGRFGAEGTLSRVVKQVMEDSPMFGFGPVGLPGAYDSAYVQILVIGGIVGLGLYASVFALLGMGHWGWPASPEKSLSVALLILAICAGVGTPTITANRAGTLIVVCLVSCVAGARLGRRARSGGNERWLQASRLKHVTAS